MIYGCCYMYLSSSEVTCLVFENAFENNLAFRVPNKNSTCEYLSNLKSKSTFECKNVVFEFQVCVKAALSVVREMWWWFKCHCILMNLLACPVEPTRCGAAALEKKPIKVEKILFTSKLKPSCSHWMYILHIYHCCTRVSHKRAAYLESSTFKKHVSNRYGGFPHLTASHVFKRKNYSACEHYCICKHYALFSHTVMLFYCFE